MSNFEYFHGTSKTTANEIVSGKIAVSLGGGELGQGFYTGEYLWVAKAWAHNRHKNDSAVVKIEVEENTFFSLDPLLLSRLDALTHSKDIKAKGTTRTHTFNRHVVWSPIVGTTRVDADQYKFETKQSETILNGSNVPRSLV